MTPPDPIYRKPHNATRNAKRPSLVKDATDLGFLGLNLSQDKPRHCSLNSSQYLRINIKHGNIANRTGFPRLSPPGGWFGWSIYLFIFFQPPLWAHTIWRRYIIKTFHLNIVVRTQNLTFALGVELYASRMSSLSSGSLIPKLRICTCNQPITNTTGTPSFH